MPQKKSKKRIKKKQLPLILLGFLFILLFAVVFSAQMRQDPRSNAAPPANVLVDQNNLSFTANGHTSTYNLYAAGLNYSNPVGMLIFLDGTGEGGIDNNSSYMMGGPNGLVAVAKKHNMVLLTPFSPNRTCKCWHEGDTDGYVKWTESLVTAVESKYQIDKRRIAMGGYSSGASMLTSSWIPSGSGGRTMDAGVLVMFSLGGAYGNISATPNFKANVHLHWTIGDKDSFLQDAKDGYKEFTDQGFKTSISIVPGMSHNRPSDFGKIMDQQISLHVSGSTVGPSPTTAVVPSSACLGACPSPTSIEEEATPSPAIQPTDVPTVVPTAESQPTNQPEPTGVAPTGTPISQPDEKTIKSSLLAAVINVILLLIKLLLGWIPK